MIIKASDWKYSYYNTEYNDDDEEILILEFETINEDNESKSTIAYVGKLRLRSVNIIKYDWTNEVE